MTHRAIRLHSPGPGRIEAALEDIRHAMICTVSHDDRQITGVEADFRRYTLPLCPGASEPLKALVGMPLDTGTSEFFANGRARQNCTHMLDLAWLAMRHAVRGAGQWIYEIEIPDALTGPQRGTLKRNGVTVQDWTVENNRIVGSGSLGGQSLGSGFTRWLTTQSSLSDLEVEESLVLQKGFFMVKARRFGVPEGELDDGLRKAMTGACFGYAPERIEHAFGLSGMERDFTHHPERLLRFE
jgi:hypothetical protein